MNLLLFIGFVEIDKLSSLCMPMAIFVMVWMWLQENSKNDINHINDAVE